MSFVFGNPNYHGSGFIFDDPTETYIAGLTIVSNDASMQRVSNFGLICSGATTAPTLLNTTLVSGNDTLTPISVTGSDPYTLTFAVGDLTKQVDATGYDWTLEIDPNSGSSTSGGTAALGWSAPSGITQGSSVSLTTDGTNPFGSGPINVKYERFDSQSVDDEITDLNSIFDDASSFWPATVKDDEARSGTKSGKFVANKNIAPNDLGSSINTIDLPVGTREVFYSVASKIPTGAYFPGGGNTGTNADYDSSSWKMAWLLGPDSATNDLVLFTHTGSGVWKHSGNDLGNLLDLGTADPSWWKWNQWNRTTSYVKAGTTPQTDAGVIYAQIANGQDSIIEYSDTPVVFANGSANYDWTKLNVNGWARMDAGGSDSNGAGIDFRYDDIYVAYGDRAAARVELGNNATYSNCTDLHIQYVTPTNWATGQLDFDIDYGPFSEGDALWLHITLEDNSTRYSIRVS